MFFNGHSMKTWIVEYVTFQGEAKEQEMKGFTAKVVRHQMKRRNGVERILKITEKKDERTTTAHC